jgi:exonuclease III
MTPPLKIIQWNARSLYKSKLQEFKYNLLLTNPHIVLLCETHWKDHYTAQFSAYQTFALNRPTQGGGVAILVKKNIQTSPLPLPQSSDIEAIGVTIKTRNNTHLDIISLYCPNGNSCRRGNIEAILNAPRNTTIIGGDFNAHLRDVGRRKTGK